MSLALQSLGLIAAGLTLSSALAVAEATQLAADLYFEFDGVSIRYRTADEGTAVIVVHGMAINMELVWMGPGGLFPILAKISG